MVNKLSKIEKEFNNAFQIPNDENYRTFEAKRDRKKETMRQYAIPSEFLIF